MNAANSILEAEGIVLERDGKRILDGLSVRLFAGKVLAVIGPNGAGKSSLLNVLSGWLKPDAGRVLLDGREIRDFSAVERARSLAVMRQEDARPAGISVLEAVELGRYATGGDVRGVAEEMLRRMDLEGIAGRDCSRLSGGEWQRACFARAAAQIFQTGGPGILLLDEPVSSLDPAHQHGLLAAARRMASEGVAVLAVLHDLNLTAMYADEVLAMKDGKVAGTGSASEMMQAEKLSQIYNCRVEKLESGSVSALVSLGEGW
jgi:iron complex transport system ATP-binding protein